MKIHEIQTQNKGFQALVQNLTSITPPNRALNRVNSASYLQKGGGNNASGINISHSSKPSNP